jgi:hypothetical protein
MKIELDVQYPQNFSCPSEEDAHLLLEEGQIASLSLYSEKAQSLRPEFQERGAGSMKT